MAKNKTSQPPQQPPAPRDNSIYDYMRVGFGLGIGGILAGMIFIFIAMLFFIPGFIIVMKQNNKPKEDRKTSWLVFGFILMAIGMIIGLGFGAGVFFGELGEQF